MTILRWSKISSGRWLLKSDDGQIWAAVAPYRSEHSCKGQFKGTLLNLERNWRSVRKYGSLFWTTGIGVTAAKRATERAMSRMIDDSYQIAA